MAKCKAHTKSGKRCKNKAVEGSDYCHVKAHQKSDEITHPKKAAMLQALEKHLGVVSTSCKEVKITRKTHYNWLKEDPIYKEAVDSISDVALDFAESELFKQIRQGIPTSTIFYLKTKGKQRGYIEKQEIESNNKTEHSIAPKTLDDWYDEDR